MLSSITSQFSGGGLSFKLDLSKAVVDCCTMFHTKVAAFKSEHVKFHSHLSCEEYYFMHSVNLNGGLHTRGWKTGAQIFRKNWENIELTKYLVVHQSTLVANLTSCCVCIASCTRCSNLISQFKTHWEICVAERGQFEVKGGWNSSPFLLQVFAPWVYAELNGSMVPIQVLEPPQSSSISYIQHALEGVKEYQYMHWHKRTSTAFATHQSHLFLVTQNTKDIHIKMYRHMHTDPWKARNHQHEKIKKKNISR